MKDSRSFSRQGHFNEVSRARTTGLLAYLEAMGHIEDAEHWSVDAHSAGLLRSALENDRV